MSVCTMWHLTNSKQVHTMKKKSICYKQNHHTVKTPEGLILDDHASIIITLHDP